jgi:hypothetical protein
MPSYPVTTTAVILDRPAEATLEFAKNGIVQGFVEGANVNPILELEMTKLTMVTRDFESIAREIESSESSLQDAIKTLGAQRPKFLPTRGRDSNPRDHRGATRRRSGERRGSA